MLAPTEAETVVLFEGVDPPVFTEVLTAPAVDPPLDEAWTVVDTFGVFDAEPEVEICTVVDAFEAGPEVETPTGAVVPEAVADVVVVAWVTGPVTGWEAPVAA